MEETMPSAGVPIGVSGVFLRDADSFVQIHRLWAELRKLNARYREVEVRLRRCNDPDWLVRFGKSCQRKRRDPKQELPTLATKLEVEKALLVVQIDEVRHKLLELDPTVLSVIDSLIEPSSSFRLARGSARRTNPDVAARNTVIDANIEQPNKAICETLDLEFPYTDRPATELPDSWVRDFDVKTFVEALQMCPNRVHKMISLRRHKRLLP
jgi:hypothetical protein